ncbi:hypothetical protein BDV3_000051 [Batrachochytrium dendrobatidis]|uniref:Molybdate-anion transporter n=1 Tax=Batrachochytrium dendrobatidis (strain JEL423) TaxID=403673 RepID=A0A177W816_BATDL|nr:hypothetical protein BDEG_20011 [Batrachochytrium dendrobatidis JEL423]
MDAAISAGLSRNFYYNAGLALLILVGIYISYFSQGFFTPAAKYPASTTTAKPRSFFSLPIRGSWTPFRAFQSNYLLVYGLVLISDWLQGPYIYSLYKSYNYELDIIALLFVTGFLSSAIVGTFVGSIADRFGRRLGCVLFCVFYALSCLTKLSPEFGMLMLGRVLGGISTSLLFTVFESWMISEHRSRGFGENLLSETFAWSTFVNGLVAIISGIVANFSVDYFGLVAPFMIAIVVLILAMVIIILTWTENYGNKSASTSSPSFFSVIQIIYNDPDIFAVGTMQFCFESAMYTFVFLWSPVLETLAGSTIKLPFGVIFSSFMVCIMIGSLFFKMLNQKQFTHESIAKVVFSVASVVFLLPALTTNEALTYIAFNAFEICCGIYFPSVGSIRSKVIPENTRSTVMNIFRIPLNLIVVLILLKVDSVSHSFIFAICATLIGIACWFAQRLSNNRQKKPAQYQQVVPDEDSIA